LALLVACGGEDAAEDRIVDDEPLAPHSPLVGTWTTTGTHEDFGAVDVVMELCQDGTLRMSVATDGGAQLNFPGVWRTEGETLVLEGEYFRPDNRSAVRWSIGADGALVLEDENGRSDEWQRSGD
tara:strand:+ start:147 stop:521 length:375 start_codon:yes stop_codon:yes gene_type:complete